MIPDLLIPHLIREESERLEPYVDSEGWWTIGVGHLIDARKGGSLPEYIDAFPITKTQSRLMLEDDLADLHTDLNAALPWFYFLDFPRQTVLYSMAFQMGVSGLLKFRNTLLKVRGGDYNSAASGMLSSLWARQTPARAARLASVMRTGDPTLLT